MKQILIGLVLGILITAEVLFLWSFNQRLIKTEQAVVQIVQFLNQAQQPKVEPKGAVK